MKKPLSINMLYLANYAPIITRGKNDEKPSISSQPSYHAELFEIIRRFGFNLKSQRNIDLLLKNPTNIDYVFSLLNRAPYRGSEIFTSAICEYYNIPYLGARPHTRAVADDKYLSKIIASRLGVLTTKTKIYHPNSKRHEAPNFTGPYIAKPRSGAASKHLSEDCIQDCWSDLGKIVDRLLSLGDDVIVEEFVAGTNASLPVIAGKHLDMLPPYILWSPKKGQLVTYEQKRKIEKNLKREIETNQKNIDAMNFAAQRLYKALEPVDYFRLDFRIPSKGLPVFLEMNICCNISSTSGFTFSALNTGLSHERMIKKILMNSFSRQNVACDAF